MKKLIAALVACTLSTMSCGAIAHGIEYEAGKHIAKHVVKPAVEPVTKTVETVVGGGSGIAWVPFLAFSGVLAYVVWENYQCDKKPLTDACHPEVVRKQAAAAAAAATLAKKRGAKEVKHKRIVHHKRVVRHKVAAACR